MTGMRKSIRVIAVAAVAALLAGCGARGPLEPPPGAEAAPPQNPPFVLDKVI